MDREKKQGTTGVGKKQKGGGGGGGANHRDLGTIKKDYSNGQPARRKNGRGCQSKKKARSKGKEKRPVHHAVGERRSWG